MNQLLSRFFGNISEESKLRNYINSLEIRSDYIKLEGPYLCEDYALKYIDIYKELLQKTYYRINCVINRPLALISSDKTLETKDNPRVEIGINPYNHKFELALSVYDFVVVGVDGNILLNQNDSNRIKNVLKRFPITLQEERLGLCKR